jgi:hypothetical protein
MQRKLPFHRKKFLGHLPVLAHIHHLLQSFGTMARLRPHAIDFPGAFADNMYLRQPRHRQTIG